ncbi:MAG TPA: exodeoxyribonuclease VII large subunit [Chitinophaga sp.]|uniref:exodeoxyribonuclease VII large subunit n=1 Tax=Chitinophaga sp. TaxID=1869181 RepID=UPI002DBD1B6A|nr:exodeoxyribonuclease VII large subunit [Chitinophaga sp.]HEU4555366.1 exodeoxyribonuclease VII large subunit [Chitinophaga sp.]
MSNTVPIRLSDLANKVQQTINQVFAGQTYWIIADVTNYSFYRQKGYHYFDLVEKQEGAAGIVAKVAAVAWGAGADKIKEFERITGQPFTNGIHVLVMVAVNYHTLYGLQITVLDIDAGFTIGMLEQQKQAVLARLVNENPGFIQKAGEQYITRNNQLQLNRVIQRVAVVSSGNSAGYQDFKHTLDNNRFGYRFTLHNYFTAVQGEEKAELLQQRLIDIFNSNVPYDAVAIIRGGGAQTDFLLFDTYRLGKTVAKFPIPVITGIGHQKNETVVDLMAHSPTKTPTKAAEFIIAHNKAFEDGLMNLQKTIVIRSQQLFSHRFQVLSALNSVIVNQSRNMLARHKDQLQRYNHGIINTTQSILLHKHRELLAASNQVLSKPAMLVAHKRNELENTVAGIRSFSRMYFQHRHAEMEHHKTVFRLMSPANILKRGFALVYQDGKVTASPGGITPGSNIQVLLTGAMINATVTEKNETNGTAFDI